MLYISIVAGRLEEQIQSVMAAVYLLCLQYGRRGIAGVALVFLIAGAAAGRVLQCWSAQRLISSHRATGSKWLRDVGGGSGVDVYGIGRCARALPSVPDLVVVERLLELLFFLTSALSTGSREEAFFALTATADAGRVVRVINGSQVTPDLTAPARNAGLIRARVQLCVGTRRRRRGIGGASSRHDRHI
jgi:hypothetical protein